MMLMFLVVAHDALLRVNDFFDILAAVPFREKMLRYFLASLPALLLEGRPRRVDVHALAPDEDAAKRVSVQLIARQEVHEEHRAASARIGEYEAPCGEGRKVMGG